jgi:HEPN domain-containing protein
MSVEYCVSHDLGELSVLLKEVGETVPIDMRTLIRLNRFAVKFRYENPEPVSNLNRKDALETVQKIRAWVEERLEVLES